MFIYTKNIYASRTVAEQSVYAYTNIYICMYI